MFTRDISAVDLVDACDLVTADCVTIGDVDAAVYYYSGGLLLQLDSIDQLTVYSALGVSSNGIRYMFYLQRSQTHSWIEKEAGKGVLKFKMLAI